MVLRILVSLTIVLALARPVSADLRSWDEMTCEPRPKDLGPVGPGKLVAIIRTAYAGSGDTESRLRLVLRRPGKDDEVVAERRVRSVEDDAFSLRRKGADVIVETCVQWRDGEVDCDETAYTWAGGELRARKLPEDRELTAREEVARHGLDSLAPPLSAYKPHEVEQRLTVLQAAAARSSRRLRARGDPERALDLEAWLSERTRRVNGRIHKDGVPAAVEPAPIPKPSSLERITDRIRAAMRAGRKAEVEGAIVRALEAIRAQPEKRRERASLRLAMAVRRTAVELHPNGDACGTPQALERGTMTALGLVPRILRSGFGVRAANDPDLLNLWDRGHGWVSLPVTDRTILLANDWASLMHGCHGGKTDVLEEVVRHRPARAVALLNLGDAYHLSNHRRSIRYYRRYVRARRASGEPVVRRAQERTSSAYWIRRARSWLARGNYHLAQVAQEAALVLGDGAALDLPTSPAVERLLRRGDDLWDRDYRAEAARLYKRYAGFRGAVLSPDRKRRIRRRGPCRRGRLLSPP